MARALPLCKVLCDPVTEALLKVIVAEPKGAGIPYRTSGDVREKVNTIEKQFRDTTDFQVQTGSGITSESTLRKEKLKRCPYYYKLCDVFDYRPSTRPRMTSDDIDDDEQNADEASGTASTIIQRSEKRPLAYDDEDRDAKRQQKDPVDRLIAQQETASKHRVEKTNRMLLLHKPEVELKQRELKLNEKRDDRESTQANVDLALKAVQLHVARREAVLQLVLVRKKCLDSGIGADEVDRPLPPPE
ncbi:hypothetical protein PInf_002841 [Phytophthora infestans]|nr:hypothetical protein PInf_002841 [Phytophthora infestans]